MNPKYSSHDGNTNPIPKFSNEARIPEGLTTNAMKKRRLRAKGIALGPRWSKLRKLFLSSNPICEKCQLRPAEEVHHIEPRSKRPDLMYVWSNLMSLCKHCHHLIHKEERQ